ncbi:hypothetical protein CFC21_034904 [Triticum aestivum]|uniref:Uncharacterized protein n=3 Tax=Triticum TaxID=4564 RepID=A0A9R0VHT2_TRITD|nr:hypothetical protein CFC21_034904 [Triticum aestivum]VAH59545.1 unnamed protein product [Triticum turgidum subsp. durum]
MASLLLLLQAIIRGADEGRLGTREVPEEVKQPKMFSPNPLLEHKGCRLDDDDVEEERWLVACLQWPRTNHQSAWMQTI